MHMRSLHCTIPISSQTLMNLNLGMMVVGENLFKVSISGKWSKKQWAKLLQLKEFQLAAPCSLQKALSSLWEMKALPSLKLDRVYFTPLVYRWVNMLRFLHLIKSSHATDKWIMPPSFTWLPTMELKSPINTQRPIWVINRSVSSNHKVLLLTWQVLAYTSAK